MKKQISKIFSSDGELSKNIKGFKPRAEQLEMAQSVGYAIQHKRPLVVEAGTEMVMPGDNVNMTIELITPIAIEKGLRFAIREGGRTVGSGVVSEIIE